MSIILVKIAIITKNHIKVITVKIGEKLKNAREDLDLSQNDVARLIPMNQSNYSKIERNIQEPNLEQFKQICLILKLEPSELLEMDKINTINKKDAELLKDIKELIKKHS